MNSKTFMDESVQTYLLNVRRHVAQMDQAIAGIPGAGAAAALQLAQSAWSQIEAFLHQAVPVPALAVAEQRPACRAAG